jgi:hypothetical protein
MNFNKKGIGYILGNFFSNASGHPGLPDDIFSNPKSQFGLIL